jgi:hypothetical protein
VHLHDQPQVFLPHLATRSVFKCNSAGANLQQVWKFSTIFENCNAQLLPCASQKNFEVDTKDRWQLNTMSEAQLKKILAENQALQQQAERSKHIIKTSIACQEYAKSLIRIS